MPSIEKRSILDCLLDIANERGGCRFFEIRPLPNLDDWERPERIQGSRSLQMIPHV